MKTIRSLMQKNLMAVCILGYGCVGFAGTHIWQLRDTVGLSPNQAALWNDAGNWGPEGPASSGDAVAKFPDFDDRVLWVRVNNALSIYSIETSFAQGKNLEDAGSIPRLAVICDSPVTFTEGAGGRLSHQRRARSS